MAAISRGLSFWQQVKINTIACYEAVPIDKPNLAKSPKYKTIAP
jgi:hypothetical protein